MPRAYRIDVRVIGFVEITVDADTSEEAFEKAEEVFDEEYLHRPISDLRWKETKFEEID